MTDAADRLAHLDRGFRQRYLDFDTLTAQLEGWAQAFPELAHLEAIGESAEGRPIWLLTIDPTPDRVRPAVWVDGNMHASELCGSSVALAIAEDVLRLHLDPDADVAGLAPPLREVVRDAPVHVLPRMSPDGAEAVLTRGPFVRSVPEASHPDRESPRWVLEDVDGDGLSLLMRVEDPTGEYVEAPEAPGWMVPRRLGDPGPYFKVYGEGHIAGWDGRSIPTPTFLDGGYPDLNRNFPFRWEPESTQVGAGPHATSHPASRAVVEWAADHPNVYVWLNLHTFGGVFIRPLGDARDTAMDPEDLAVWRELGAEAEEITGYPMVSGFEEFTYVPETPIHGTLSEWAWAHRGCFAFVCELWDLFRQVGIDVKKRFVDHYGDLTRDDVLKIAAWDAEHNDGRVGRPWRPADHPQLGAVEVGGLDPRFGLWNPPESRLSDVCDKLSRFFLRVAARLPRLHAAASVHPVGGGLHRVELVVENQGYLSTRGPAMAKALPHNEPVRVVAWAEDGASLLDPTEGRRDLGHLDGWGRGRFGGAETVYLLRSRGSTGRAQASFIVRGRGTLRLRVGSPRVGLDELSVPVG